MRGLEPVQLHEFVKFLLLNHFQLFSESSISREYLSI